MLLKFHKPDIIQTHGYKANFFVSFLKIAGLFSKKQRWIAWIHGWTSENLKVKLYHLLEKMSIFKADSIVCVSTSLAKKVKAYQNKITIIPNGIDESYDQTQPIDFSLLRNELRIGNKKIILVVGRFSFEKGFDRIPYIAENLKRRRSDFIFLLIGEGPERNNIFRLSRMKNITDKIILHHYVSDIRPYYRLADICLMPSRKEGMPNVVLEALYIKCVLVAFDVGGVTEIIEHNKEGLVAQQGDINHMVDLIDNALNDPELCARLCEAGHKKIKNEFLNSSRSQRVFNIYKQIVKENESTTEKHPVHFLGK